MIYKELSVGEQWDTCKVPGSFTSCLKDLQEDNVSIGSINACKLVEDPQGPVPLPNSSAAFKVA